MLHIKEKNGYNLYQTTEGYVVTGLKGRPAWEGDNEYDGLFALSVLGKYPAV